MAPNKVENELEQTGSSRRIYGDTVIENGARAHLGDISSDVKINGGLHIHFPPSLDVLSNAVIIKHFVGIGKNLLELGERLANTPATDVDKEELSSLPGSLSFVISWLKACSAEIRPDGDAKYAEKALHDMVLSAQHHAQGMKSSLDLLLTELQRSSSFGEWSCSTFRSVWQKEHLGDRLAALRVYQVRFNMQPHASISGQAEHQSGRTEAEMASLLTTLNRDLPSSIPTFERKDMTGRNDSSATIHLKTNGDSDDRTTQKLLQKFTLESADQIKSSLYFRAESDRRLAIKDAHSETFKWIFRVTQKASPNHFREWLEYENSTECFWMNGKAGSGKSTLMKYIAQQQALPQLLRSWAGNRQLIIATFFFWYAGEPLQKSHEGVLRSLLFQVLDERPTLTPVIFPRLSHHILCAKKISDLNISAQELEAAVILLSQNMPDDLAIFMLIDGVDEYTGDHHDFSRLLVRIAGSGSFLKVLVSSRPVPACCQVFSRCPSLRLQDLTLDDMRRYVEEQLIKDELFVEMDRLEQGFAREVKHALATKSSGVFLWLVLVVKRLSVGLGNYDDKETLMAQIDELPSDLEALYDHMFGSMSTEYQRESSLILQLSSRAQEIQPNTLTPLQLYVAVRQFGNVDLGSAAVTYSMEEETLRVKAIEGKLRSRCCGLVEVQDNVHSTTSEGSNRSQTVGFLHRTVFDYLRDPQTWEKVTTLYKLTQTQIDLTMLASCAHMLKHEAHLARILGRALYLCGKVLDEPLRVFKTSLLYSRQLSDSGSTEYPDCLEVADVSFMQYCLKMASYQLYREAYGDLFDHDLNMVAIGSARLEIPSLAILSFHMVAAAGLPEYHDRRVGKHIKQKTTKSLLLLYLLHLVWDLYDSEFGPYPWCLQSIRTLLKHGADPNCATSTLSSDDEEFNEASTKATKLADTGSPHLVPWNLWLCLLPGSPWYISRFREVYVHITLELIQAGAQLHSDHPQKRAALKVLYDDIVTKRRQEKRLEMQQVLDEILSRMEMATESTSSMKRHFPSTEYDERPFKRHQN